jgi:hypothetical protein
MLSQFTKKTQDIDEFSQTSEVEQDVSSCFYVVYFFCRAFAIVVS